MARERRLVLDANILVRAVLEAERNSGESWLRTEAAATYDGLKADPSRPTPPQNVRADFQAKWAAHS